MAWNLFGSAPHRCWQCKREPLKIADVGEHRRRYPGGVDEFLCRECQQETLRVRREETRARLEARRSPS